MATSNKTQLVVLHIARTPVTGVWTLMRHLATWQVEHLDAVIAIRVITDKKWPESHYDDLKKLNLDTGYSRLPWLGCGSLNFLSHLVSNPVSYWVKEIEQKYSPESIIIHFHNAWLSGSYLPLKTKKSNLFFVCTFHGINDLEKFRRHSWFKLIHSILARRLYRYKVCLVSVDSQNTLVAEEVFNLKKELFNVVPNGVPATAWTHNFRKNNDIFTLGYVGFLIKHKGWHIAAKAVSILAGRRYKIQFLIAGDGPDKKDVEILAQEHPEIFKYVGFVRNPVDDLMPQLDGLVLPSTMEGLPMVILEAFSLGIPVVATAVGGIPDIIIDGVNGFLVERDAGHIADKIAYLIDHPDVYLRMKQEALDRFTNHFSIEACGRSYEKLYNSLLNGS